LLCSGMSHSLSWWFVVGRPLWIKSDGDFAV
jgi:hypothetical protein